MVPLQLLCYRYKKKKFQGCEKLPFIDLIRFLSCAHQNTLHNLNCHNLSFVTIRFFLHNLIVGPIGIFSKLSFITVWVLFHFECFNCQILSFVVVRIWVWISFTIKFFFVFVLIHVFFIVFVANGLIIVFNTMILASYCSMTNSNIA